MNSEEIKQQFDTLLPAEVNGSARPMQPLSSDNDFYLDVPQLIRNDVVLADSMNLIISTLLSNDKVLNTMIDAIKDQLANADLREVTQVLKGLMSPADKKKLDGIATNANNYTHPNSGVTSGTYKSVTVNAQGHVTGGSNPTTLAGYGITDAAAKSHGNHVPATQTADNTKFLRNDNTWQQVTPGNIGAPTKTGGGAGGTWGINVTGNAATATKLNSKGRQTAITGREEAGLHMEIVYNNGYPCSYGNVITVGGEGGGQLLLGWSGTNGAVERVYYRNRRDQNNAWSEWRAMAFTTDKPATAGTADTAKACSGNAVNVTQKKSATAVTHSGYGTNNSYVPDMAFIAFWNGAFNSSNSSNLKYCAHGEIIGSNNISNYAVAGNKTHGTKLFTDNGTFTVPAGVGTVVVTAVGGGGGGGRGTTKYSTSAQGGSGGCGAMVSSVPCMVTPGMSISVIVGKCGTGGALETGGTGGAGNPAGGNAYFPYNNSESGGAGGAGGSNKGRGGAGGAGLQSTLTSGGNKKGGGGGGGASSFGDYVYAAGGGGGGGAYVHTNAGVSTTAVNGRGGSSAGLGVNGDFLLSTSYGAGGAGGNGDTNGANGNNGCVYVRW